VSTGTGQVSAHHPRFHRPSMTPCVYCGLPAYSVIEVRYARTVKYASTGMVDEEEAPREVIARGYYTCDGCMALLDFKIEHHLSPRKHSSFNLFLTAYHMLVVWSIAAVFSLALGPERPEALVVNREFLLVGVFLALASLIVWFFRATVHSRYYGRWLGERSRPMKPRNSLAGFTVLRDRVSPELAHYLPVRFSDSFKLLEKRGSPPLRSLGPSGEPWADSPPTNFEGSGVNEWYRLIWTSWQLWPLRSVEVTEGWEPPPGPKVREIELALATVPSLALGILVSMNVESQGSLWLGLLCGLLLWPIGFFVGLSARQWWEARRAEIDRERQVR